MFKLDKVQHKLLYNLLNYILYPTYIQYISIIIYLLIILMDKYKYKMVINYFNLFNKQI